MKEQLEILKKWVATGQVKTARGRHHDDLLTLIGQMEIALSQPPVIGSVCTCTKFRETPMINGKHICSICNKPIVQPAL